MHRRPDRIIVPQYTAPEGISLLAAAELLGDGKRAAAAQVIDLVVRKVLAIERKGKGFLLTRIGEPDAGRRAPEPGSHELTDELDFLLHLFGPGRRTVELRRGRNRELGQQLRIPQRDAIARLIASGLAAEIPFWRKLLTPWRKEPIEPTPAAHPIVDHLWGIHDYVQLAEQERFRVLQSPDGAQLDALQRLVLNERLLPFAVLFGLEKEWLRQLDVQYRDLPPEFAADLGDVLVIVDAVATGLEIAVALADIATIVDAADALEGLGAVFGGIGEALSNVDFDLPDLG